MLLQLVLVVVFILFEEIVWEEFAKPIYLFIHELQLLQRLQKKLQSVNRYAILILFVLLLVSVESAGVMAGVMAVKGMVLSGMLLYALKIPIAAFTFWLFRVTEKQLLSFEWFDYLYGSVLTLFAWIKSREIYRQTVQSTKRVKLQIKESMKHFKQHYLSGENTLSKRFKRLYRFVKRMIRRV